jgi:hypothetical protein
LADLAQPAITAAAALGGVLVGGLIQWGLARQARRENRKDRLAERRADAYSAYLAWAAQRPNERIILALPVSQIIEIPEEQRERARKARVVFMNVLLYGSPAVKLRVRQLQILISTESKAAHQEILSAQAQQSEREINAALIWATRFQTHVWPEVDELASTMSRELEEI